MFLLIDNYDSFVYNLRHFLGELGGEFAVHRNDAISVADAMALQPEGIVISPGPCDPDKAGICLDLVAAAAEAKGPAARRLPRPSDHRPGVRRQSRARAGADAWQAQPHAPQEHRRFCRSAEPVRGHTLSLANH